MSRKQVHTPPESVVGKNIVGFLLFLGQFELCLRRNTRLFAQIGGQSLVIVYSECLLVKYGIGLEIA